MKKAYCQKCQILFYDPVTIYCTDCNSQLYKPGKNLLPVKELRINSLNKSYKSEKAVVV